MEEILRQLYSQAISISRQGFFINFSQVFSAYAKELSSLHFSYFNPVFDILILLALLILLRTWGVKKAVSYCLIVSLILVLSSSLNGGAGAGIGDSAVTYADITNLITFLAIAIITIYYSLLR